MHTQEPRRPSGTRRGAAATWVAGIGGLLVGMGVMWLVMRTSTLAPSGAPEGLGVNNSAPESATPVAETPEALARAAFEALRAGSFRKWAAYIPGADDMSTMYDRIVATATDRSRKGIDEQLVRDGGFRGMALKQFQSNEQGFKVALAAARAVMLDWDKAEFLSLDATRTRFRERYGVKTGRIAFRVKDDGRVHIFSIRGCANLSGRWLCGDEIKLLRSANDVVQADRAIAAPPARSGVRGDPPGIAVPEARDK